MQTTLSSEVSSSADWRQMRVNGSSLPLRSCNRVGKNQSPHKTTVLANNALSLMHVVFHTTNIALHNFINILKTVV